MKARAVTVVVCCGMLAAGASATSYRFTTNADFSAGIYTNTNSDTPPGAPVDDHVQLNAEILTPFNHIWVALSGRDGVARIDTDYVEPSTGTYNGDQVVTLSEMLGNSDGPVMGEYLSHPGVMAGNPSRVTTDVNGDVWVGNRNEASGGKGSAVKISANPTGTTSSGVWNGSTFDRLAWTNSGGADTNGGTSTAADTAISLFVRTNADNVRAVAIDQNNDVWLGGYTDHLHELHDGDTGALVGGVGNSFNSGRGGYGALVDGSGVVWSANWPDGGNTLVRHDPATNTTTNINMGRNTYGLGIDNEGDIWVANWDYGTVQQVSPAGAILGTYWTGGTNNNRGVAVTPADNDVWVAGSGTGNVARLNSDGTVQGVIPVGNTPTGVAVDNNGKVWVTNYGSDTVMRIDPTIGAAGAVDLTIELGSNADPYNYSDMTGTVVTGTTIPAGVWSYLADTGTPGYSLWDKIFWNTEAEGYIPADGSILVEARAGDNAAALGGWTPYLSGETLGLMGQYLEVRATLTRGLSGDSPILSDLSITVVPEPLTLLAVLGGLGGLGAYVRKRRVA